MTSTEQRIWNAIIKAVAELQKKSNEIVLYKDSRQVFEKNFEYYYKLIEDNFMAKDVDEKSLDRHKVAAVIVCSI